jgi:hypothetical protein
MDIALCPRSISFSIVKNGNVRLEGVVAVFASHCGHSGAGLQDEISGSAGRSAGMEKELKLVAPASNCAYRYARTLSAFLPFGYDLHCYVAHP